MAEPALRSDVLNVLADAGVAAEAMLDDHYRLSRGDELVVLRLMNTVSRSTLAKIERQFGIPLPRFYPPAKLVQVPKASDSA